VRKKEAKALAAYTEANEAYKAWARIEGVLTDAERSEKDAAWDRRYQAEQRLEQARLLPLNEARRFAISLVSVSEKWKTWGDRERGEAYAERAHETATHLPGRIEVYRCSTKGAGCYLEFRPGLIGFPHVRIDNATEEKIRAALFLYRWLRTNAPGGYASF